MASDKAIKDLFKKVSDPTSHLTPNDEAEAARHGRVAGSYGHPWRKAMTERQKK